MEEAAVAPPHRARNPSKVVVRTAVVVAGEAGEAGEEAPPCQHEVTGST